jgi:diacylglycerol O-acyltransferase
MRRVTAPRPGTLDSVLELARLAEMEAFDRARPLWKVTLIDGLANGEAAVLWTFHHALSDGVGSVQIATTLFDSAERPQQQVHLPTEPGMLRTSWLDGYRDTLRYVARAAVSALTGAVRSTARLTYQGIRQPVATVAAAAGKLNCPACGKHPTIKKLIDYNEFCGIRGEVEDRPGVRAGPGDQERR